MQISYDTVSTEYVYPLSKKEIKTLFSVVPKNIADSIVRIRFGCNTQTTQEARIVQHGNTFHIRINFCLRNNKTPILGDSKNYTTFITKFGGVLDWGQRSITWNMKFSKRYIAFLFFHEIGHVLYSMKNITHFGSKSTSAEETWCDEFAVSILTNEIYSFDFLT